MADSKKVVVGVCAMEKKSQSKPMIEILSRMREYYSEWLEFSIFPETVILNEEVADWPKCDCLISFQSKDFPLEKAIRYTKLHPNIYVINDLERQFDLLDRAKVYEILGRNGIDHPRYEVFRSNETAQLIEAQDFIEVNGVTFNKPFVEKPLSAEDHNICIYYPSASGGGSQRLFRKVNNRSSAYDLATSTVRRDGSYIYEQFMQTAGTDVKVYAVGPDYAHAEARKSPALDGKVDRNRDGKEVRYPVILTAKEKLTARKVVLAFKQTVCGFDLLRANGQSYVCDVNGFSFVKTSRKYYEDTAKILGNMILRRLSRSLNIPWKQPYQPDDPPLVSTTYGKMMELRCVLGIIRHGERTPKQKMKMEVTDKRFFDLFEIHDGFKHGELKLKKPSHMKEILNLARTVLVECRMTLAGLQEEYKQANPTEKPTEFAVLRKRIDKTEEQIRQWEQVRGVLEMYGYFSGINRKVQLKYCPHGRARRSSDSGTDSPMQPSLLLILKWGGELTRAGRIQAESLGRLFRTLYPGIDGVGGEERDNKGLGFLRLHSTYRHDLKIYASDEGRVQMTAAAFTKGLLALEGELAPILSQMVKSANTDGLLDDDYFARKYQTGVKKFLHDYLQMDKYLHGEDIKQLNPLHSRALKQALTAITNPRKSCEVIDLRMKNLHDVLRQKRLFMKTAVKLYQNETWDLVERRWLKLIRDFRRVKKDGRVIFDITKIPDIYDNIRYEIQHNPNLLQLEEASDLYYHVKLMADVVVPQEYGINKQQKLSIAQGICIPLMKKIRTDLQRCIEGVVEDENLTRLDPRATRKNNNESNATNSSESQDALAEEDESGVEHEQYKTTVSLKKEKVQEVFMQPKRSYQTVNLLAEHNKLISTAVIRGCLSGSGKDQKNTDILNPATVMARGASAPDLKGFEGTEGSVASDDDDSIPPLFSLETLHNQLSHRTMDEFLETITTLRTPLPSPPKTPLISREDSSLSETQLSGGNSDQQPERTLEVTAERLRKLSSADQRDK